MLLRLSLILLALALPASFPAESTQTLRQRYGQPVSETFLIRPGIFVTASYGASGNTCGLFISPVEPDDAVILGGPDPGEISFDLLEKIDDELVPKPERGKFKISTLYNSLCIPENFHCAGSGDDWENIEIYRNSGQKGARYETITWKRAECRHKAK